MFFTRLGRCVHITHLRQRLARCVVIRHGLEQRASEFAHRLLRHHRQFLSVGSTMKPPMPLSKSASALQTISVPCSPFADTCRSNGAGGGVVSLVAPVFT